MKIKEYKTLYSENSTDLDLMVNEYINHGWQPYGPQIHDQDLEGGRTWYNQVMVKYEKK